jgi:hypothetical protein
MNKVARKRRGCKLGRRVGMPGTASAKDVFRIDIRQAILRAVSPGAEGHHAKLRSSVRRGCELGLIGTEGDVASVQREQQSLLAFEPYRFLTLQVHQVS